MKHKKLYQQPITTNNPSLVCPDVCDSDCPYGCYPYDDTYALPPPPIPQSFPPPPSPPSPHLTNHNISPYVIIASTFFGITLLLIIYYIIFIKNCFMSSSNDQHDSDSDSSNDIQLPTIDHPIWYIRTVGLQPSIINSITVFNFKKGESLIEGTDCSVCLNEFQEGELLRLLPKCNHAFHIPCIDTWLRSHTTCPVCRAGILVSAPPDFPPTARDPVIEITESPEAEVSNNSEILENVEIQTENSPGLEIQDSAANREKLVKRCVSADSFPMSMIKLEMVNLQVNGENQESPFNQRRDICSTSRIHQINNDDAPEQPFSNRDVSVKRSFSYGGRSFLSRHPREVLKNTMVNPWPLIQ